MIIGTLSIDRKQRAVHTHRDSYLIDTLSVVSVRRPLLPAGIVFGTGLAGFTLIFGDLLFAHEFIVTPMLSLGSFVFGTRVGQLKLLSRDLRGSELSDAVWGDYARLNAARREIISALSPSVGDAS